MKKGNKESFFEQLAKKVTIATGRKPAYSIWPDSGLGAHGSFFRFFRNLATGNQYGDYHHNFFNSIPHSKIPKP